MVGMVPADVEAGLVRWLGGRGVECKGGLIHHSLLGPWRRARVCRQCDDSVAHGVSYKKRKDKKFQARRRKALNSSRPSAMPTPSASQSARLPVRVGNWVCITSMKRP